MTKMGNQVDHAAICRAKEDAIEFFEALPDKFPGIRKYDKYETALNTFRYCASRLTPITPVFHKGIHGPAYDTYTCGACGRILDRVAGLDKFCPECGRNIKWGNPACLTGRSKK